jgi:hypothetical protein
VSVLRDQNVVRLECDEREVLTGGIRALLTDCGDSIIPVM